jgi:hypothetical protein
VCGKHVLEVAKAQSPAKLLGGVEHDLTHLPCLWEHAPDVVDRQACRHGLDGIENVVQIPGQGAQRLRCERHWIGAHQHLEDIAGNGITLVLEIADGLPPFHRRARALQRGSQDGRRVEDRAAHLLQEIEVAGRRSPAAGSGDMTGAVTVFHAPLSIPRALRGARDAPAGGGNSPANRTR